MSCTSAACMRYHHSVCGGSTAIHLLCFTPALQPTAQLVLVRSLCTIHPILALLTHVAGTAHQRQYCAMQCSAKAVANTQLSCIITAAQRSTHGSHRFRVGSRYVRRAVLLRTT